MAATSSGVKRGGEASRTLSDWVLAISSPRFGHILENVFDHLFELEASVLFGNVPLRALDRRRDIGRSELVGAAGLHAAPVLHGLASIRLPPRPRSRSTGRGSAR